MKHVDSAYAARVLGMLDSRNWDSTERLGGAMEVRVSVRSLVQQLVHEQAKASVHLEGLQRDVTTLLDFRESVLDSRPAAGTPLPTVTVQPSPAAPTTDPATPTDLASAGTSGLGTSTASTGTSGGAEQSAAAATCQAAGGAVYRPAANEDELMSLLETIESRGRQLLRQKQRTPLSDSVQDGHRTVSSEAAARTRPRCNRCDRDEGASPNPDGGAASGARRRTLDTRRPSELLFGGLGTGENVSPPLPNWIPAWERSPVFVDPPPLSLPNLRPGQERLAALSLSERLLQERDALLERLTGLEQVAVRSQLHTASLQNRLHRVLAVNDALDRELRLAGGQRLRPRPTSPVSSGDCGRMARSTPDLRPSSRIPQPLSLRRHAANRGKSQHPVPGSRSRETQTSVGAEAAPPMADQGTTTAPVDSPVAPKICTSTVGTSTRSLNASTTDEQSAADLQFPPDLVSGTSRTAPAAALRPPNRTRVSAILRETSPLKLQKELLTLLVEAEALRAQVDSLGRRWAVRASSDVCGAEQADSDDIRLQLEMRNIELEGTRARLRQLESAWAARSDAAVARSSGGSDSAINMNITAATRRSPSPRLSNNPTNAAAGRNSPGSGNQTQKVAEAGNQSDSLRRIGRQPGASPRPGDGAEKSGAVRRPSSPARSSPARRTVNQSDASLRQDRLSASSPRSESLRPASSGSGQRVGASLTSRSDKRPDTPTRSSRPPNTPSRPGSRSDTPSGRPNNRSKTPTRPHSRTGLSSTPGNSLRTSNTSSNTKPVNVPGSSSKLTTAPGNSGKSPSGSWKAAGASGSPVKPMASAGRRVADLVRGWTESIEPQRPHEKTSTPGPEQTDHKDKVRRRGPLPGEPSAKIPATQSQALGQILAALSRGHSPRAPPPEVRAEGRPGAELRWLRQATAQRLRQARLETSDGEVADSLTSATASEDGCEASLEERLKLLDDGLGGGGGGGRRYGDGMVLSAGEGLIQRILSGRTGGQRFKPRPAPE